MLTWAVSLRLNEIIDENKTFVELKNTTETYMYTILLNAYRVAYINADSLDEFKAEFQFYWNKNIDKYTTLLDRQKDFYTKLFSFRDGTSTHDGDRTTSNKQTKTEEFSPTETVKKEYDHTMQQDYKANTDDTGLGNKSVEKRFEQNAVETEVTANTSTKYTYASGEKGDMTTRGGKNTTKTSWSGEPDSEHNNLTITDSLSDFSPERFEKALKAINVYDLWIDEFSPLFSEVLFYD